MLKPYKDSKFLVLDRHLQVLFKADTEEEARAHEPDGYVIPQSVEMNGETTIAELLELYPEVKMTLTPAQKEERWYISEPGGDIKVAVLEKSREGERFMLFAKEQNSLFNKFSGTVTSFDQRVNVLKFFTHIRDMYKAKYREKVALPSAVADAVGEKFPVERVWIDAEHHYGKKIAHVELKSGDALQFELVDDKKLTFLGIAEDVDESYGTVLHTPTDINAEIDRLVKLRERWYEYSRLNDKEIKI